MPWLAAGQEPGALRLLAGATTTPAARPLPWAGTAAPSARPPGEDPRVTVGNRLADPQAVAGG